MFRMSTLALAAVLAVGGLAGAGDAFARGGHGGGHGGGGHGGGGPASFGVSRGGGFSGGMRSYGVATRSFAPVRSSGIYRGHVGYSGFGLRHRHAGWYGGRYYRPYLYAGYYGYNSCYRWRRVWTPWGPRLRRVNVCAVPYRYGYGYGYGPYWNY